MGISVSSKTSSYKRDEEAPKFPSISNRDCGFIAFLTPNDNKDDFQQIFNGVLETQLLPACVQGRGIFKDSLEQTLGLGAPDVYKS